MSGAVFDYQRFVALDKLDLVDYMEPLVLDGRTSVAGGDLEKLLGRLDEFDEYHLVYALQLIAERYPERIVEKIPGYLRHQHDSVRAAVLNIVAKLPNHCVTRELLERIKGNQSTESRVVRLAVETLERTLNENQVAR